MQLKSSKTFCRRRTRGLSGWRCASRPASTPSAAAPALCSQLGIGTPPQILWLPRLAYVIYYDLSRISYPYTNSIPHIYQPIQLCSFNLSHKWQPLQSYLEIQFFTMFYNYYSTPFFNSTQIIFSKASSSYACKRVWIQNKRIFYLYFSVSNGICGQNEILRKKLNQQEFSRVEFRD